MAPVSELRHRRAIRVSKKRETPSSVLPWTIGDDSDGEDNARDAVRKRSRARRQAATEPAAPAEGGAPPAGPADAPVDEEDSVSETDGISSNSGEETEEETEAVPGSGTQAPQAPEQTLSSTLSRPESVTLATSTTVSQSFTTLIPGGGGAPLDNSSRTKSATRFITSLTPVLTVVEPETTYTSYSVFTTIDEPAPQIPTWTSVPSITSSAASSTATRAAQTSAAADADSSPTPQIIRVHEHPHGLSKDAIHGLIAFGALGGLMGVLAILWFFWRRYKKNSKDFRSSKSSDASFSLPSRGIQLLAKIPFLKERFGNRSWFNIDEPYYKNNNNSRTSVFLEKSISIKSTSAPRLDSQFFAPNQVMGVAVRVQGGDHPPAISHNFPGGGGLGHHPVASISSTHAQRSNTVRNREPPFPTNQSKRVSEISSLSSGFGDGDLLVPNGQSTMERLPQPPPSAKFAESVGSRRDTVYTEASEDQPPRFRNVNSWVRQQTGRVKRSQAKAQAEDAPPVPQMPSEENYAMMLPDGEEPRRPQFGAQ